MTIPPRIRPLSVADLDEATARRALRVSGPGRDLPKVVATMAHHPELLRRWLQMGTTLYPGQGRLAPRDSELLILRTAAATRNGYEWEQHATSGRDHLSDEEIARVLDGADAPGWSDHDAALLRAVDEIVDTDLVSDASWASLCRKLDEGQLLELMFVVGTYRMLAGMLRTIGVTPDSDLSPAVTAPEEWAASS